MNNWTKNFDALIWANGSSQHGSSFFSRSHHLLKGKKTWKNDVQLHCCDLLSVSTGLEHKLLLTTAPLYCKNKYITGLWKCITIIIITTYNNLYYLYYLYYLRLVWPLITDKTHIKKSLHGEHGSIGKAGRCIHLITNLYSSTISDTDVNCLMFGWLLYLFIYVHYPLLCVLTSQKFLSKITVSLLLLNPLLYSQPQATLLIDILQSLLSWKKIFKDMLLNGAELSGNGKGWLFPCPVQSHLSTMYVNEIQNIASELQDTWLKMSYNEKPPSVILWWAVIIGYGSVSSWAALKATAIRAEINHFRTYKTTVHFYFFFAYLC